MTLNLARIRAEVAEMAARHQRDPGQIRIVAVSKTRPAELVRAAAAEGQREFGENYVQEALEKMPALADLGITWHFIGPVQSNKTRQVAQHFDWVHSLDRERIARRLSEARAGHATPLNVCLQVNISGEDTKSGASPGDVPALACTVAAMPNLRLRGLMALPAPTPDMGRQRAAFASLRELQERLLADGMQLDTLSMGTTSDLEAAIAEGSTLVRIGTAIFGPRR